MENTLLRLWARPEETSQKNPAETRPLMPDLQNLLSEGLFGAHPQETFQKNPAESKKQI